MKQRVRLDCNRNCAQAPVKHSLRMHFFAGRHFGNPIRHSSNQEIRRAPSYASKIGRRDPGKMQLSAFKILEGCGLAIDAGAATQLMSAVLLSTESENSRLSVILGGGSPDLGVIEEIYMSDGNFPAYGRPGRVGYESAGGSVHISAHSVFAVKSQISAPLAHRSNAIGLRTSADPKR